MNIPNYKTVEYHAWLGLRQRCNNPSNKRYPLYGGRGITVCDEWNNSFLSFLSDMGRRPSKNHSLDRIDNNGGYCKENCRWATKLQQSNNTRKTKFVIYEGERISVTRLAAKVGIKQPTLHSRMKKGWELNDAILVPKHKNADIEYDGYVFKNLRELSEYTGVHQSLLWYRINKMKLSVKDAVSFKYANEYVYKGVVYKGISALALAVGMKQDTLYARLRRMDFDAAVTVK